MLVILGETSGSLREIYLKEAEMGVVELRCDIRGITYTIARLSDSTGKIMMSCYTGLTRADFEWEDGSTRIRIVKA